MPKGRPDEDGLFFSVGVRPSLPPRTAMPYKGTVPSAGSSRGGVDSGSPAHTVGFEEILENLIRVGADYSVAVDEVCRYGGDAKLSGEGPIGVNGLSATPGINGICGFVPGKPHGFGKTDQFPPVADILEIDIIGLVDGLLEFIPPAFFFRPLAQFLCQAAVVGPLPIAPRQIQLTGHLPEPEHLLGDVYRSAAEEVRQ